MPIHSIVIEGLKSTKEPVIWQWIKVKPGDPISRFDAENVKKSIVNLGIFKSVDIEYFIIGEKVKIVILIEEKITLYPVPILMFYRQTRVTGLLLAETNFLGYNKGLVAGGANSNRGNYYLWAYTDPNIMFSDFFGRLTNFGGKVFTENAYPNGKVFQSYEAYRFDVQYYFGHTFWNFFSPTLTGAFRYMEIQEGYKDNSEEPPSGSAISQGIKFIFSNLINRYHYQEGFRSYVEFQHGFPFGAYPATFNTIISESRYTVPAHFGHFFSVGFFWSVADYPAVFESRLGGQEGTYSLPSLLVPADNYFTGTISYHIPLLDYSWGNIVLHTFFENGVYQRNQDPFVNFAGPGLGLRLYLSHIDLPVVGGDVAYNIYTHSVNFSISIGYRETR